MTDDRRRKRREMNQTVRDGVFSALSPTHSGFSPSFPFALTNFPCKEQNRYPLSDQLCPVCDSACFRCGDALEEREVSRFAVSSPHLSSWLGNINTARGRAAKDQGL